MQTTAAGPEVLGTDLITSCNRHPWLHGPPHPHPQSPDRRRELARHLSESGGVLLAERGATEWGDLCEGPAGADGRRIETHAAAIRAANLAANLRLLREDGKPSGCDEPFSRPSSSFPTIFIQFWLPRPLARRNCNLDDLPLIRHRGATERKHTDNHTIYFSFVSEKIQFH